MIVTRKHKLAEPKIKMSKDDIKLVSHFSYLGVILDKNMTFRPHFDHIAAKWNKLLNGLAVASRSTWGMDSKTLRIIYRGAIEPLIFYCVPVFMNCFNKIWCRNKLAQIKRGFVLRIIKAYRTISTDAALVNAGMEPLFLTALAKAELALLRKDCGTSQILVVKPAYFLMTGHPAYYYDSVDSTNCVQSHKVEIYTDGSKIIKGNCVHQVGCGFVAFSEEAEICSRMMRLSPECSIVQAELLTIKEALLWAIDNNLDCCFYSDSQTALKSILNTVNLI